MSDSKPDTSPFTTCKAYSSETLDVFYAINIFTLRADCLESTLKSTPHVARAREIRLSQMTPIDVGNQTGAMHLLSPIDWLKQHCNRLRNVSIPYTLGIPTSEDKIFKLHPVVPGAAHAMLVPRRFPFQLFLCSDAISRIWPGFLAADANELPVAEQLDG